MWEDTVVWNDKCPHLLGDGSLRQKTRIKAGLVAGQFKSKLMFKIFTGSVTNPGLL